VDSIFGIPAHPLFVHIPVVLIPLATIGVVLMAIRPTWWDRYKWPTVAIAGVGMIGAIIAAGSGEELEEAVENTAPRQLLRAHVEAGEISRTVSIIIFVVLVAAVVVLPWWMKRRATTTGVATASPRGLRSVVSVVLIVSALGASWTVYDAGHIGAKSVWSDAKIGAGESGHERGGDHDD